MKGAKCKPLNSPRPVALHYLQDRLISSIDYQSGIIDSWMFPRRSTRTPIHLQLHLIVENYATHKRPTVEVWLEKHKRFHHAFHADIEFVGNILECFLRKITAYLRDDSLGSVRELPTSITRILSLRNAPPMRYVWNAKNEDVPK